MNFEKEKTARIKENEKNEKLIKASKEFMLESTTPKYSYNFCWLGRPIIQYPQDIVALQEIIWNVKPDLIIETGIAHGGSLIFSASMLSQLDLFDSIENKEKLDSHKTKRKVLGIDIDIRKQNLIAIKEHPLSRWIEMIEGSSIDSNVIDQVYKIAEGYQTVLVLLDSNHTHSHVLDELNAYAPLVSVGSYCIVYDTVIEDLPNGMYPNRDWDVGNNPKTAVREYLSNTNLFSIEKCIPNKLLITVAHDGYLKRVK